MDRSRMRWLLVVVGTLIWVLAVYPAYYVVHKPLSAVQLQALANVAGDLLTWLAMIVVGTALGSRLTQRISYHSLLERLIFSAGLGLICLSLLTYALGLVGLLYRGLFWALLIGGGILLWRELRKLVHTLPRAGLPRPHGAWPIFLSLFIACTLLLTLATALLPPFEWDSLLYHLEGPERYLEAHRLTFEFDNHLLFYPTFTEMLFLAGMTLKGDVVPRLIHYGYLLLMLGAFSAFATRYWERRLGLLVAALFLSIPSVVLIASWSYVDITLSFYSLAAVYALLNWLPQKTDLLDQRDDTAPSGLWMVLAGLFAGACAAIKYTGVGSLLTLSVVLLWWLIRRRLTLRQFVQGLMIIVGLTLVVSAPVYVKNTIVTGNPIYPVAWGGREWNEISTRWLVQEGPSLSIWELLILPWRLTIVGKQGTVAYDFTHSPLFLILLPLLLVVRRHARGIGELLLTAAVGYLFWIASGLTASGTFVLIGRLLLPIFGPLSLLCAYSLEGMRIWDRPSFSLRRVLIMLTGLTLAFGLVSQMLLTVGLNPWPYLTGHQSRDAYLDIYVSQRYHQAITYLNNNLTAEDKVLFVWEPRGYGCLVPHEADPLWDNFSQALARYGTPAEMIAGLHHEGFTHVLVNEYLYSWIVSDFPITTEEKAAWEELQRHYFTDETLVHAEEDYLKLYRLRTLGGP